ncbi:MAG: TULIP family P47-like protein [Bacteroidota bacterium]
MILNGWDTVSIIQADVANQKLKENTSHLIMDFDTTWEEGFSGTYKAKGTFGSWWISGGSGDDLHLRIPIKSGEVWDVKYPDKKTEVAGYELTFEVNLKFIPATVPQEGSKLTFDIRQVNKTGENPQQGDITLIATQAPSGSKYAEALGMAVARLLTQNKDKITFVFAEVGAGGSSLPVWLRPVKTKYSYHQPLGEAESFLAILSVTSDKDIAGLSSNIESAILPKKYPLSFAISGALFLKHIYLPVLPGAFKHATLDDFSYADGKITLSKHFDLDSTQVSGTSYTPVITSMTISIDSDKIKNDSSGRADLHLPNAYISFATTLQNKLEYSASTQRISFDKDPHPQKHSSAHIPWYDYLLGIGSISDALIAAVTDAVELHVGAGLATDNIAGSLRSATANVVSWGDGVSVKTGVLNDCFYMQGDLS